MKRGGLPPGCSGDDAVDNYVDGEAKPLLAIAGDHLRGVERTGSSGRLDPAHHPEHW